MLAAAVLGFSLLSAPAPAEPPPTEEQVEARLKAIQRQIEDLRRQEDELRKELAEAKSRPVGGITATVRGILKWNDDGGGYYILIREGKDPPTETRVWLWISENKVLVRQLEGLTGKEVTATGSLHRMPKDVRAIVPPLGLYLPEGFKIEEAPAKRTEKTEKKD